MPILVVVGMVRRGGVVRLLLLCLLGLGIVGMHSVVSTSHEGAHASSEQPAGEVRLVADVGPSAASLADDGDIPAPDDSHHSALHQCVTILSVTGALLLLARLVRTMAPRAGAGGARRRCPPARRKPLRLPVPHGRVVLTEVCVLRV